MFTRILAVCIALIGLNSTTAQERSLVVSRRTTTAGAIVAAPQSQERSVVVASREVPATESSDHVELAPLTPDASSLIAKQRQREAELLRSGIENLNREGVNQQILVRIEMLEVSRTKLRKLGTDLPSAPGKSSNAEAVDSILSSLKENGVAKTLSRPNLVVTGGRPASFFVGGEITIPSRDSAKAVEFQKFGTEVDLLATAIGDDQVRTELRIKVSELDHSNSIEINGARVPGLTVRQCDTALSVACGETGVIEGPGVTRTETYEASDGKKHSQDDEIVLLIAVTPEIVNPIAPPQTEPSKASSK
jgi:Flp pilus assembly secretin CpaC